MVIFKTVANLCYIINKNKEVLLQFKSKGFGLGKWNGPGGKKKADETIEQSVIREVREETGLEVSNLEKRGELEFIGKAEWKQIVHVFVTHSFSGQIIPSEEGELRWFKINELPLDRMWEDDSHWLSRALAGEFIRMRFYFDANCKLEKYKKI